MSNTPKTATAAAPSFTGEAIIIDNGFLVVNQTNGKLECFRGPSVIGGITSGNLREMLVARAEMELGFAQKSELTTDESSPDDEQS